MILFVLVNEILHDLVVLLNVNAHIEIFEVFGHNESHLVGNRPLIAPFQIGAELSLAAQPGLFLRH